MGLPASSQPLAFLLRARSQPDDTSNCTSAQAKPPSPTSSTHSLQHHRYPVDHSCVAAETRPQIHRRPKAKYLPSHRQRSQVSTNVCLWEQDRSESAIQEHRHSLPNRNKNTYTLRRERIPHQQPFLLPSQTGGVRSLPYTRQPVDLFCHDAERTVRCWNPAINSFPGLPSCAHDIDCDSNYPAL